MAKICVIADLDQYHSRRWIGYFLAGNEITLVYYKKNPKFERFREEFLTENLKNPKFKPVFLPLRKFNIFDYVLFVIRLLIISRKEGINIFYVHYVSIAAYLSAFITKVKYVLCPWGSDILIDPYKSIVLNHMVKKAVKRADVITANSKYLAEGCKKLGASEKVIRLVQLGIDLDVFHPGVDTKALKDKYSIKSTDKIVLSARNFRSLYNIDMIVRSIPETVARVADVKFILMTGQGPDTDYTERMGKMVSDLGIADKVIFVGGVRHAEMAAYYCMSNIVISVPSSDSSPSFLHEAMACAVPPIVSDLPSIKELFTQDVNAEIVPQKDHKSLAKAAINLLEDDEKRRRYAEFNLDLVKKISDVRKNVLQIQKIFDMLEKSGAD
ncbi:MAG: glycosyltransferase [Candidatus Margulisiibacteriota bacterium]